MTVRPSIILLLLALSCVDAAAQAPRQFLVTPASAKPVTVVVDAPAADATSANTKTKPAQPFGAANEIAAAGAEVPKIANPQFRLERLQIANGAELLTIFGRLDGLRTTDAARPEVPLISVVRDTLADTDTTNDRLRYRSHTEGEMLALGEVVANDAKTELPINDAPAIVLSDLTPAFTPGEMLEMRARLILSRKTFGGLVGPETYRETVTHRTVSSIDNSGHNWELLRQRAEAEGLYFEPLTMPDGQATHAILWIARSDLRPRPRRQFNDRFLNITDPWSDGRLRNWNGYSRVAYLDGHDRQVRADDPDARAVEIIPLALYGLDHPKIPALLIDFRHSLNPKRREISRRLLTDLAKNVFSVSNFGNLPYFVGRNVYDFITRRRGMDLNQPSRLQSYSELKLLLSFNSTIDPSLRKEI